jgi:hypothetical protein
MMYDIWVNQENPSRHLVLREGTQPSQPRKNHTWSLLGRSRVDDSIAAAVERDGRAEVLCVGPFDPHGVFRPGGEPNGSQVQIPE